MKSFLPILFSFFIAAGALAQCTIDTSVTNPGMYPADWPTGIINKAYSGQATLRMPVDTLVSLPPFGNFLIPYDSAVVLDIHNLPAGMTWSCNMPDCKIYAGNLIGCVEIGGTPTAVTDTALPIVLEIQAWLTAPIVGVETGTSEFAMNLDIIPTPNTSITGFANVSDHGSTVQWSSDATGDTNDYWVTRYHKFGDSPNFNYKLTPNAFNSTYTNNLEPNTRYVYREGFRASGNSSAAFSDTASVWTKCANPSGFSGIRTGPTTATLSWTDVNSDLYKVRYRPLGSGASGVAVWSYKNVPGPASGTTLSGLTLDDYVWQVRSICDHSAKAYATSQILPGGGGRLAAPMSAVVELYPNPATSNLTINVSNFESVVLHNSVGAIVRTSTTSKLNVNDLSAGIYTAMIYHSGIRTVKRLVIE